MSTLYHLTSIDHLRDIMKNGLIPQLGENCKLISDERSAIFLCEQKDIGIWRIILGNTILLSIEGIDKSTLTEFNYSEYSEYLCDYPISPENIRAIRYDTGYSQDDMVTLCGSYLTTLSIFTVRCARYYENAVRDNDDWEFLKALAKGTLFVLKNLDYSVKPMEYWADILRDYGECGEYTFCDMYMRTSNRLWQQLLLYDNDELRPVLIEIYNFINNTFPFAKELCTGGYGI